MTAKMHTKQDNFDNHILSRSAVCALLAEQEESCNPDKIGYYTDIQSLAEKVRSSKNWSQGEVFVCAQSDQRFIVMKQIAPSSCEMLTISNSGFQDVLTAYRFELEELVATLDGYMAVKATSTQE
jgi:hypothetical protein